MNIFFLVSPHLPCLDNLTSKESITITSPLHLTHLITILGNQGILQGDEEHVSGWDLVYDNNGYIEIDPEQCGYSSFLGAAVPEAEREEEGQEDENYEEQEEELNWKREGGRRRSKKT